MAVLSWTLLWILLLHHKEFMRILEQGLYCNCSKLLNDFTEDLHHPLPYFFEEGEKTSLNVLVWHVMKNTLFCSRVGFSLKRGNVSRRR